MAMKVMKLSKQHRLQLSGDTVWKDILKNEDEVNGDLVFM